MIWNLLLRNMREERRKRRNGCRGASAGAKILVMALLAAVVTAGCQPAAGGGKDTASSGDGAEDGKIRVVTTIFPQYDFVREIAGDEVDLQMLLKPGEESHSYEPTPRDIIAIQNCDIFIYVGGENDVWVEDILESMPASDMRTLRLLDCVDTVEEEHVEGMKESVGGHSHDGEEDGGEEEEDVHSVHEIDEHVWTSPVNAAAIVDEIAGLLEEADPGHADIYEENAAEYTEKLMDLDGEFRDVVEHAERSLLIFGDRFPFRYFADEYGLDYYAAFPGCASDTEPSAATMVFLIDKVKEENAPAVLKMELSNADIANAVAEATGTEVRVFYSCHNLSAEQFENGESYLTMMEQNVETLKEVLN